MLELPMFRDPAFLNQALTHRSYLNEHPNDPDRQADNQRLEFLGDAVLGFVIGELLYRRYPTMTEGQLTPLRSKLVDETQLARFGRELQLGDRLWLGKGAERDGGRQSASLLSDAFEALIGAYFLDSGIEAVQEWVAVIFTPVMDQMISGQTAIAVQGLVDPKSRLQQWSLAHTGKVPEYFIVDQSGPDHAKVYIAGVQVQGQTYQGSAGRNKKEAEKKAATTALKALGLDRE